MTRYIVVRANTLLFGVLVATLLLIGVAAWDRLNADQSARGWSQHSYQVLGGIQDLNLAIREAESGQRGYLLTGKAEYLAPYQAALARVDALQSNLLRLTADNPTEQERMRTLAPILRRKLEEMARAVQVRDDTDFDAALKIVQTDTGIGLMQQIDAVVGAMRAEEQRLLAERIDAMESRGYWVRGLLLGGAVLALAALLWAIRLLNQAWSRSVPSRGRATDTCPAAARLARQPEPGRRGIRCRRTIDPLERVLSDPARSAQGHAARRYAVFCLRRTYLRNWR